MFLQTIRRSSHFSLQSEHLQLTQRMASMNRYVEQLANRADLKPILAGWVHHTQSVIEEALRIQAIPSPTFEESARADYVERRFRSIGLAEVSRDDLGNVYGRTPGYNPARPAVLISAHLDTVFPSGTDLTVRRDQQSTRIYGPGLGDNSLGLAAMIALAEALRPPALVPPTDLWWVATVGEEGLGDLRGMRRVFTNLRDRVGVALVLEGIGLGRVYHAGLGVRRVRVTVQGPGGHSWLHAERPSAIHHLVRIGAALLDRIEPSGETRTSFNIGLIEGGTSINTRAPQASMAIDLRSVDANALAALESRVREIVVQHADTPDLTTTVEVIGDRPSAALPIEHSLVQAVQAVLDYLGHCPCTPEIGSTDANIPLAGRMPAVCVGITTGGDAHTAGEYIDTEPVSVGMQQVTLLALMASEQAETWAQWDKHLAKSTSDST